MKKHLDVVVVQFNVIAGRGGDEVLMQAVAMAREHLKAAQAPAPVAKPAAPAKRKK